MNLFTKNVCIAFAFIDTPNRQRHCRRVRSLLRLTAKQTSMSEKDSVII